MVRLRLHFDEIVIPNTISLENQKWFFTHNKRSTVEALSDLLAYFSHLFFLGIPVFFVMGSPSMSVWVKGLLLITGLAALALSLYSMPKLRRKIIESQKLKCARYRKLKAPELIEELKQAGYTIVGDNPEEVLITNDQPYVLNTEGVRYLVKGFQIWTDTIETNLKLSDSVVENQIKEENKLRKEETKLKRISYLVNHHESVHGPMTPEEKSAFVSALDLAFSTSS